MKKFIYSLLFAFALLLAMPPGETKAMAKNDPGKCFVVNNSQIAPAAIAQEEGGVAIDQTAAGDTLLVNAPSNLWDVIKANWITVLFAFIGFIEAIVRLTPTEKDNSILNWVTSMLAFIIPNFKKGGGIYKVSSN